MTEQGHLAELADKHAPRKNPRNPIGKDYAFTASQGQFCRLCGCWKGALGLEPTPEMFCAHLVEVFREVKRVLRDDGTLWLNLASSYSSGIIESQEYILRDDLTPEERGYVYSELAKHFGAKSENLPEMRESDAPPESTVS